VPAKQLDEVVWADLCQVLLDPTQIASALERAQTGAWLPQELQARQATLQQALAGLERQQERLLTAYLGEILDLSEFERKRRELAQKQEALRAQHQQLAALTQQRIELGRVAASLDTFCQQVRSGLATATFEQKRQLVELLIDHVVVTDEEVEIRYVIPTSSQGARQPFCHLRLDYRKRLFARLWLSAGGAGRDRNLSGVLQPAPAPSVAGVSDSCGSVFRRKQSLKRGGHTFKTPSSVS